jgi:hypothetical protein
MWATPPSTVIDAEAPGDVEDADRGGLVMRADQQIGAAGQDQVVGVGGAQRDGLGVVARAQVGGHGAPSSPRPAAATTASTMSW